MGDTTTLATGIDIAAPTNETQTMRAEFNAEITELKSMLQAMYDRDNTWVTVDETFDAASAGVLPLASIGLVATGFYTTRNIPVVGRVVYSDADDAEQVDSITGGQDGMILIIKVDDGSAQNLVIADGASIITAGSANITMTPGDVVAFTYQDSIWTQISATTVE